MAELVSPQSGSELWKLRQSAHRCIHICSCLSTPFQPIGTLSLITLHSALGIFAHSPHKSSLRAARTPGGKYQSQANHLPKLSKVSFWPRILPETQPKGRGEMQLFITKLQTLPWNNFSCLFHSSNASDVQSTRGEKDFLNNMTCIFKKVQESAMFPAALFSFDPMA